MDDFALEEYRCLRTEMMHHAEKTFEIERYTATALAVIYSWLLSRTGPAPSALWILPPAHSRGGAASKLGAPRADSCTG